MLRPPKEGKMDMEKVKVGEFVFGTIEKIQYERDHVFKGFEGKEDRTAPAVRFVFKLQGYEFNHYSRWMKFSMDKRANLFDKYVTALVANAKEYMDFDLEELVGMDVKMIWDEKNSFQSISNIWPVKKKITVKELQDEPDEPSPSDDDFIPEIEENDVPL